MAAASQALRDGRLDEASAARLIALSEDLIGRIETLERLVEHVPAVLYIDRAAEPDTWEYPTLYVGPQVESILGIARQDWLERDDLWQSLMHPEDWPLASRQYAEYVERGGVLVQEYRLIRPDNGATVWVRDDCTMSIDPRTGERIVLGVMFDVTEQKLVEEQLRAAEAKNRVLIEQIPSIVWIEPLGANPEPAFVSASVREVFGVDRRDWLASRYWEHHLHPDDRDRVLESRRAAIERAGKFHSEYRMSTVADRVIWIEEVSQVVLNDDEPWSLQGLLDDVTSRKKAEQRLQFRASHDPLTGLANRPLFDESLLLALGRAGQEGFEVVVLFVDVDRFKQVNDVHGHDAGDQVLRVIASRLKQCARTSDLVARRGGDEYLVLLSDIEGPAQADAAHARARGRGNVVADIITDRILESMRAPIELPTGEVTVSLSIGRCVYPWDADDARSMMAAADASMYAAKHRPRGPG